MNDTPLTFESIFIPNKGNQLHVKRIYASKSGIPVFMVHGSLENGRIFYTNSQKGYACYLAKQGYDVFVVDLRGRGESTPLVKDNRDFGQKEVIDEDFDAYLEKIKELKGDVAVHWVSHSWAEVNMLAYYARKNQRLKVLSMVFFGTKRRITTISLKRFWMIEIGWIFLTKLFMTIEGYLPAKKYKMGADDETKRTHSETTVWVRDVKWLDWFDGFNYAKKLQQLDLPPILSYTGANDAVLGHPTDVHNLLKEIGGTQHEFKVIGKKTGHLHDYDHITLVTHKDAPNDHFPLTFEWLRKHDTRTLQN